MEYKVFTSESVSCAHPDKICDQISDAILDEAIKASPAPRVAVETLVTKEKVVIAGEVTCPRELDYQSIARGVIRELGYTDPLYSFTHRSKISVFIHQQSADIAVGVERGGAGDQGMMFGYACTETKELMPLPIMLAHRLVERVDRLKQKYSFLRPDGKSEVKVVYENGRPKYVQSVVLAVPYDCKHLAPMELKNFLIEKAILPVMEEYKIEPPKRREIIVNGTGRWEIGGPAADTGVTGRKIMVDTYGAMARHGGGCFSGKDPTKVDRSGAYAARFLAKNIVAKGFATRCEVQLAYVIGRREPIAKSIETFGTHTIAKEKIERFAFSLLDLSVPGIIKGLGLFQPIYKKTATYGHFGRAEFPWERVIS